MKTKILILTFILIANSINVLKADTLNSNKGYTLQDCINQAVNNLPEISAAASKVEQQKKNLRITSTLYLPVLDTEIKYNRLPESTPQKQQYLGDSLNDFQADIVIKQPVYTGGRIASRTLAVRSRLESAENEYRSVLNDAVYKVKISYYRLLYSLYMLNSRKDLLESMQWFYETAVDLNRKTKTPRQETLLRIEVHLNQTKQNMLSAKQNYAEAQKNLLAAMGKDISESINIAPIPEEVPDRNKYPGEMPVKTPEAAAADSRIKENQARVREAESEYYPEVSALLSYGYEWPGTNPGDTRWTAGLSMNFSLWNWGRTKAEVNSLKERTIEFRANKKTLLTGLELALESARIKYKSALDRFKIASKNIDLAKRSLEIFEKRYNNTTATSNELLDAHKAHAETLEAYASSLLDMRTAAAEIYRITGEYFENK